MISRVKFYYVLIIIYKNLLFLYIPKYFCLLHLSDLRYINFRVLTAFALGFYLLFGSRDSEYYVLSADPAFH